MDIVLTKALALATPKKGEEEALKTKAEFIVRRTKEAASSFPEVRDVELGGSFAKGTWLPGRADLDVFLKLDPSASKERFELVGLGVGEAATRSFPRGKKYAQHPYTEADIGGVKVNIVPCYDVRPREWKSAADRSPFHVELVRGLAQGQKDQVRLLKLFMQGIGTYGAEIEIQGFSGYAAEVLIIRHNDFLGVLKAFAGIKPEENGSLLRLPDPVDETRDLARAISREKIAELVLASRKFLSSPSISFFGEMTGKRRPELVKEVVGLVFAHKKLSEDTLWGELRRTLSHVRTHAEERGFVVARAAAASNNSDRSALLFIPEFSALPKLEQRTGPTIDRREDAEAFARVNRRRAKLVWVDDEARIRILQERDYTDFQAFLKELVRSSIKRVGASEAVGRGIAKTGRVLSGVSLRRAAASSPWLREGLNAIASDTIGTGAT